MFVKDGDMEDMGRKCKGRPSFPRWPTLWSRLGRETFDHALISSNMDCIQVRSSDELWRWLEHNHSSPDSIRLITWIAAHKEKNVSRDAVLDALMAYGWIDGRRFQVDADRTAQLIAPRKQQAWSQSYKDRIARLRSEGKMRPAGEAAVAAGQASGLWNFFADVDALKTPRDLTARLDPSKWEGFAPSYQKNALRRLHLAKTRATREKRIKAIVDATRRGERLPQM